MERTGGSRPRRGGHAGADDLRCSFCGQREGQVQQVIAGPGANICNGCVARVHDVLATPGTTVSTPTATIRLASDAGAGQSCSFCGKSHQRVETMASTGDWRICTECLDLCDEIIASNQA